ncbi:36_t:CDS:10 [Funneliformis geosporum]|nr:36_t:CDS:10 [Funneliformis geosporum]
MSRIRLTKAQKAAIVFPPEIKEVITGMVLSDACIVMNGKEGCLKIKQYDPAFVFYLWNLFNELRYRWAKPKEVSQFLEVTGKTYIAYAFSTFTLPYFTELHSQWYRLIDGKNVKVLPLNIAELLTPIALAYWQAGDAHYEKRDGKFNINATRGSAGNKGKEQYVIRIPKREVGKVQALVAKHIPASMAYRFVPLEGLARPVIRFLDLSRVKVTHTGGNSSIVESGAGVIEAGVLLSDGWLSFASSTNKNARLGFEQSLAHLDSFLTLSGCLTELHSLFYFNGVKKKLTKAQKAAFDFPPFIQEVITGMLLSDATLVFNGKYARMQIKQKDRAFVQQLWNLFNELGIETGKTYSAYGFKTFTLPYFTESHSIWYVKVDGKNVKVIPSNFADLITPISLAYWVDQLRSVLKDRYGIESSHIAHNKAKEHALARLKAAKLFPDQPKKSSWRNIRRGCAWSPGPRGLLLPPARSSVLPC